MSERHPIISITGSSSAGTLAVTRTFENILWRKDAKAAVVEGDSFHRYECNEMRARQAAAESEGNLGVGTKRTAAVAFAARGARTDG